MLMNKLVGPTDYDTIAIRYAAEIDQGPTHSERSAEVRAATPPARRSAPELSANVRVLSLVAVSRTRTIGALFSSAPYVETAHTHRSQPRSEP